MLVFYCVINRNEQHNRKNGIGDEGLRNDSEKMFDDKNDDGDNKNNNKIGLL